MSENDGSDLQGEVVLLPEDAEKGFDFEDVEHQRIDIREAITRPSEKARLINRLGLVDQYKDRLDTLDSFAFLRDTSRPMEVDIQPPSYEAIIKSLRARELKISTGFQKPTLIIRPEISMRTKIRAIDANLPDNGRFMSGSEAITQVNESFSDIDAGPETVAGWRSFIVDGAREMEPYIGDSTDKTFKDRISWRQAGFGLGENDIDPDTYLMLVMEAIKNGHPIDQDTYTLFSRYNPDNSVPRIFLGKWSKYYKRPILSWDAPLHNDPRARFRSSVGGRLIK
jgi:hypothetical protein